MRPRPRRRRKAAQISTCAFAACALVACSWALTYYSDDIGALFRSPPAIPLANLKLLTGSLLAPVSGNTCRQSLIDNATGQIRDNGFVDCDAAKAQAEGEWTKELAVRRQTIFRNGFVNATGEDRQ